MNAKTIKNKTSSKTSKSPSKKDEILRLFDILEIKVDKSNFSASEKLDLTPFYNYPTPPPFKISPCSQDIPILKI